MKPPRFSRRALALSLLCLISAGAPSRARSAEIPLTMKDVARLAVLRHPELRSAAFSPAIAGTAVEKARSIYDPVLTALLESRGADSKIAPESSSTVRTRSWDANLSLAALLESGASASASVSGAWSRTRNEFSAGNSVEPSLSVSVSQPLLKDAGKAMNERGITTATYAHRLAEADWFSQMLAVSARACTQYLSLLKARESHESRKASVEAAKRLHLENQARVRAGVLAPIDLLDSELGVATREVDLLQAEKAVRDAEDALRYLVNASPDESFGPADPLPEPDSAFVSDNAVSIAIEKRPEIEKARLSIRNDEFGVEVARNQMKPDLSMKATAGLSGLAENSPRAAGDIGDMKYPFWMVGVELAFPVRNGAARADHQSSRLRAGQSRSVLAALEESVALEVRNALRAIDTRHRQIGVAKKGVEVAESRLASFVKRNALGMATTRNVLDAETDLTAARETLTLAKADYQAALVEYYRATGELPERQGIVLSSKELSDSAWRQIR